MKPCAIVPLTLTADPATAFSPVAGEAPLARVVRSVRTVVDTRIVVATVPALAPDARTCLHGSGLGSAADVVVSERSTRRQLLFTGLRHLGVERDSTTHVLICDVHHPFSQDAVAARVIAALRRGHDVVVPTVGVTDTVKTVDEEGRVLDTLDRSILRSVQYPRGFTASALWDLVTRPPGTGDDDEFGAAMQAGLDVGTVGGDPNVFRIELPRDAQLLEAIIACRAD
jgi:2-C-methyl-D-erythritol 4-phosphate cytidylyltransferase